MKPILAVEHLSKRYVISHETRQAYDTLRDVVTALPRKILARKQTTTEELWALRDVSFEAQPGDRVGVIGRNGAGKSTLLKLLSRITAPSSGRITLRGRVASLLEVGTGFHPELTGRENIFLNGAVLGMTRAEVRRRFDEIVDFAGVERFLDTPVKRYSSGMYVRLAFAVAAHLESEVLIVDEVLSVGDAEFQKKCLGKMDDVAKRQGRTLLFVSHNMGAIQQLCNHAVVLMSGSIAYRGDVSEGIRTYLDNCVSAPVGINKDRSSLSAKNQFVTAHTADSNNAFTNQYKFDDPIRVCFELFIPEWNDALHVSLSPYDKHRRRVFTIDIPLREHYRGDPFIQLAVTVPGQFLCVGDYSWMLYIHDPLIRLYELNDGVCEFSVLETGSAFAKYSGYDYGCVYPPAFRVETPSPG